MSNAGIYYRKMRDDSATSNETLEVATTGLLGSVHYISDHKEMHYIDALTCYCNKTTNQREANPNNSKVLSKKYDNIRRTIWREIHGANHEPPVHKPILIGSMSLRWEALGAGFGGFDNQQYSFSSIISMMTPVVGIYEKHGNKFRNDQIQKDISSSLISRLMIEDNAIVMIDFLEERYDVFEVEDGKYITLSEALMECAGALFDKNKIISNQSDKFFDIWKEKCLILIELLKKTNTPERIYLIRNHLSTRYGDLNNIELFNEQSDIIKRNNKIIEMEDFFCRNFKSIQIIDPESKEFLNFTDCKFQWGCKPEYKNHAFYAAVGLDLFRKTISKG